MDFKAFFKLSYGLYIISSESRGKKNGYVANTAFQVTAEPAQVAISCNKDNLTCEMIEESGRFSISILKQDASKNILGTFGYKSGKDIDKFTAAEYVTGKSGVPIVTDECIAWFECKVVNKLDVGSHILFIGKVLENKLLEPDGEPLTYDYYHKVKKAFAPKNAPTYVDESKLESDVKVNITDESEQHKCLACGHIYNPAEGDPDGGIAPGTPFEDIPDDWVCPVCGATKDMFIVI